jgi:hypothetical protein
VSRIGVHLVRANQVKSLPTPMLVIPDDFKTLGPVHGRARGDEVCTDEGVGLLCLT